MLQKAGKELFSDSITYKTSSVDKTIIKLRSGRLLKQLFYNELTQYEWSNLGKKSKIRRRRDHKKTRRNISKCCRLRWLETQVGERRAPQPEAATQSTEKRSKTPQPPKPKKKTRRTRKTKTERETNPKPQKPGEKQTGDGKRAHGSAPGGPNDRPRQKKEQTYAKHKTASKATSQRKLTGAASGSQKNPEKTDSGEPKLQGEVRH